MNKTELVAAVAAEANVSKKEAAAVVDATFAAITKAMVAGDKVQLVGFGTFGVKTRAARQGRNPQTGKAMTIAASKGVSFSAGSALKAKVNK